MALCKSCKWEKEGMICLQGHVRRIKYENLKAVGHSDIGNCHAWKEKSNFCMLQNPRVDCIDFEMKVTRGWCKDCINRQNDTLEEELKKGICWCDKPTFKFVLVGETTEEAQFCPICSRSKREWGK